MLWLWDNGKPGDGIPDVGIQVNEGSRIQDEKARGKGSRGEALKGMDIHGPLWAIMPALGAAIHPGRGLGAVARMRVGLCCAMAAAFIVASPRSSAQTPLPDPVYFRVQMELGVIGRAKAWLDAGLPADFEGDRIGTGLMIGAWEGNIALMALFLKAGARLDRANALGETALMHAAWKGHLGAVDWLLKQGASARQTDGQWSALHYAVFAGHRDVADRLLAAGAPINARSPNGSNVLMMAVYEGREDLVRWALEHGADPGLRNEKGDRALEWAMKYQHKEIARMVSSAPEYAQAIQRPQSDWGQPQRSLSSLPPRAIPSVPMARQRPRPQPAGPSVGDQARSAAAARRLAADAPELLLHISAKKRNPREQSVRLEQGASR